MDKKQFKEKILPIAESIYTTTKIVPIITMTQAAHESNWGNSGLTEKANNLFGYTADDVWIENKNQTMIMQTTEYSTYPPEKIKYWNRVGDIVTKIPYSNGSKLTVAVPFRKYETWEDSVKDWARNISLRPRYAIAYKWAKEGNLEQYAVAVQAAGYATDPHYSEQLVILGKRIQEI